MDIFSLSNLVVLFFAVPGFLVVWSYRYFSKSDKISEFEYIGFSLTWGFLLLIMLAVLARFISPVNKFFQNPIILVEAMVIFAPIFGLIGSHLFNTKWFNKFVDFYRPENFGK